MILDTIMECMAHSFLKINRKMTLFEEQSNNDMNRETYYVFYHSIFNLYNLVRAFLYKLKKVRNSSLKWLDFLQNIEKKYYDLSLLFVDINNVPYQWENHEYDSKFKKYKSSSREIRKMFNYEIRRLECIETP